MPVVTYEFDCWQYNITFTEIYYIDASRHTQVTKNRKTLLKKKTIVNLKPYRNSYMNFRGDDDSLFGKSIRLCATFFIRDPKTLTLAAKSERAGCNVRCGEMFCIKHNAHATPQWEVVTHDVHRIRSTTRSRPHCMYRQSACTCFSWAKSIECSFMAIDVVWIYRWWNIAISHSYVLLNIVLPMGFLGVASWRWQRVDQLNVWYVSHVVSLMLFFTAACIASVLLSLERHYFFIVQGPSERGKTNFGFRINHIICTHSRTFNSMPRIGVLTQKSVSLWCQMHGEDKNGAALSILWENYMDALAP